MVDFEVELRYDVLTVQGTGKRLVGTYGCAAEAKEVVRILEFQYDMQCVIRTNHKIDKY